MRHEEAKRFLNHETDVLVCTDAVGMGMNLPIRRVVFLETQKFDGYSRRSLNPEEFKQIAGRAGRKGVFKIGYVSSCFNNSHISKVLNRPDELIENAYISFPETLINMKYSLSEIIRQWKSIGEKPGYYKADMKDKLDLCMEAEPFIKSKEVLYKLINLPFDIKNNGLYHIWMDMVKNEASEKLRRFTLDDISIPSGTDEETLGLLEQSHKICDLCYAYADRFGIYEDIEIIQYNKQIISDRIIIILKTTNMKKRECRECGKELSWNYTYPICSKCHKKIHLNYYDRDMNLFNRINLKKLKNMYA